MIVAVGHKTRHIIKARVSDLRLRKQLRILAKWGAGQTSYATNARNLLLIVMQYCSAPASRSGTLITCIAVR
jgi:hypothetical protein